MQAQPILLEKRGSVAILSFNRPEIRNAVSAAVFAELEALLLEIAADDSLRVVMLTGAGGQFCAGADLNPETEETRKRTQGVCFPDDQGGDVLERGNRCILLLRNMRKPVIARISGDAVGMGCSLALACDLRIAGDSARFGFTFSRLGLGPDGGASYFLTQIVGTAKALELTWFGDIIDADEALRLGLVNKKVAEESLEEEAWRWAERLASGSPIANAMTKEAVYQSCQLPLSNILDLETRNQRIASRSDDLKEGIKAFFERRKPQFRGH